MTLRIDNRTNYRTEDLRVLIAEALERDGLGSKGVNVRVTRARGDRGCSGYAWYHSRRMVLRVPEGQMVSLGTAKKRILVHGDDDRALDGGDWDEDQSGWWIEVEQTNRKRVPWDVLPEKIRDDLARVTMHEAAHCRGVRHGDMARDLKRCHRGGTDDRDVSWASAFTIRRKEAKPPKAKPDLVAERAAHVAKQLARAERRLKLARTIAAKWRRKAAYYARRAAASETKP